MKLHNNNKANKPKSSGILWRMIFFSVSFVYMEIIFHLSIYGGIDGNIIHPVMFAAATGLSLSLLCSFWPGPANAIAGYALFGFFSVYYVAQFIYYKIFRTFLSLVSIGGAGDAMNFKSVLFDALKSNWYFIVLLILPLITLIFLNVFLFSFKRCKVNNITGTIKALATELAATAVAFTCAICFLGIHGDAAFSPYELFHGRYILELSMNKLGVIVTTARDCITMITRDNNGERFQMASLKSPPESENKTTSGGDITDLHSSNRATEIAVTEEAETEAVYIPQIDDSIDFTALYNSTDDEDLKNITAYLSGVDPTYTDEYTGMFEGYNVVYVTAESLSTYGISEEATPTLYKIYHQGFEFTNYYDPLWYHSTIDGEYTNCLSQYPASSKWSFQESANTYQPYALGNILNLQGYKSYGYHDFDATYYDRTSTHPNMGYTTFKAIGAGLELTFNNMYSDLECMEKVYQDFIGDDHFNVYFMSFSGHLPYDYDYQYICLQNRKEAEAALSGKDLSDEAVAYVAAQMELDKALKFLMDKLEAAGKLDNTVFIVAPDHYPYGLSFGVYNELAGEDIESDPFELHRNQFGIWSSSMDKPVTVDKLCSSVDILPTVLNLLGADFDSRLLAGRNILSDSGELVIFSDQSFITDKVKYNTQTGEVTCLVPESEIPEGYIEDMIADVENRLFISEQIIDTDYFAFVYGVDNK